MSSDSVQRLLGVFDPRHDSASCCYTHHTVKTTKFLEIRPPIMYRFAADNASQALIQFGDLTMRRRKRNLPSGPRRSEATETEAKREIVSQKYCPAERKSEFAFDRVISDSASQKRVSRVLRRRSLEIPLVFFLCFSEVFTSEVLRHRVFCIDRSDNLLTKQRANVRTTTRRFTLNKFPCNKFLPGKETAAATERRHTAD